MLKAIGKHVIARPVRKEDNKKVLILTKEVDPEYYEVMSCGSDVCGVCEGDLIRIHKYGTHEIDVEGEKMVLISQENIYAKKV